MPCVAVEDALLRCLIVSIGRFNTALRNLQEFFLGSSGMFGLLQALVGEGLPGSTPCVAVGNALLQGPVVLHFPQALVNRIKQKALDGDHGVVQLCVDMYRCGSGIRAPNLVMCSIQAG